MTYKQFAKKHGVTMKSYPVAKRPTTIEGWDANHHLCILFRGLEHMVVYYSMGKGLVPPPKTHDVLCSLAMDATDVALGDSFEDWCLTMDCDRDSRAAYVTWEACKKTAADLRALVGEDGLSELLECEED